MTAPPLERNYGHEVLPSTRAHTRSSHVQVASGESQKYDRNLTLHRLPGMSRPFYSAASTGIRKFLRHGYAHRADARGACLRCVRGMTCEHLRGISKILQMAAAANLPSITTRRTYQPSHPRPTANLPLMTATGSTKWPRPCTRRSRARFSGPRPASMSASASDTRRGTHGRRPTSCARFCAAKAVGPISHSSWTDRRQSGGAIFSALAGSRSC